MKVGIDLVEHSRIRPEHADRILSDAEKKVYSTFNNKKRQIEYIASRFAVKEAIFKVYVHGDGTLSYKDISVLNDSYGAPYIVSERIKDSLEVSISHTTHYSEAIVIRP